MSKIRNFESGVSQGWMTLKRMRTGKGSVSNGKERRGTYLPESPDVAFDIAWDALVCVENRGISVR